MHSLTHSDNPSCGSETELFRIELSDLHVSEEDSISPGVINSTPSSSKRNTSLILEVDWNARTEGAWKPHPMFGKMTPKEWGKLLQIHVDYHLRQFAA
jgi:Protein of unknown function (DUF1569)